MAVGVEAEEIAKGLDGDHRAGNRILFMNDLLKKNLQRFPSTTAQLMQKISIIEKVPAQDLRDAEDEMPVGNLLEHMCTEPLPEFTTRF